jgi:hypothetical protein
LAWWLAPVHAAPHEELQSLWRLAERLERQRQWEKASQAYDQILARDHNQRIARERGQLCRRHVMLSLRHRDFTFREQLLTQDPSVLLQVYGEVLAKLRANYVDEKRTELTTLFCSSLNGLRFALDDEFFRKEYLAGATVQAIHAFEARLGIARTSLTIRRTRDAEAKALEISLAAQKALRLKPAVTIMELIEGACSGLDEHTSFLTPRQLTLSRQAPAGASVLEVQLLDSQRSIGYLLLASFGKTSPQELDQAILQLKAEGIKALIIDLRGNPGGSFEAAIQVVERFLSGGVIVSTQSHVVEYRRTYRANNRNAWTMPLVVLIDSATASAAEIAAGAWKDHQRATLVGETTSGKASIQGIVELDSASSGIRLTLARFSTPHGQCSDGNGITPHILIEQPPESLYDTQLEEALQEAARLLETTQ